MATSTVYKMAGLGSFQTSQAYRVGTAQSWSLTELCVLYLYGKPSYFLLIDASVFKLIFLRFSSKELSYLISHICSLFGPTLVKILLTI
jgi:hypothetical protein